MRNDKLISFGKQKGECDIYVGGVTRLESEQTPQRMRVCKPVPSKPVNGPQHTQQHVRCCKTRNNPSHPHLGASTTAFDLGDGAGKVAGNGEKKKCYLVENVRQFALEKC